MFEDDDLISIRYLNDLLFCERRAALHLNEQIWINNQFTTEGLLTHKRVDLPKNLRRGDKRNVTGMWLVSHRLGLIGKGDLIEMRTDELGPAAFWIDSTASRPTLSRTGAAGMPPAGSVIRMILVASLALPKTVLVLPPPTNPQFGPSTAREVDSAPIGIRHPENPQRQRHSAAIRPSIRITGRTWQNTGG